MATGPEQKAQAPITQSTSSSALVSAQTPTPNTSVPAHSDVSEASAPVQASSIPNLRDRLPKLQPRKRREPPSNPTEVPQTPPLPPPPDLSTIRFQIPKRRILSKKDHELFLNSPTYTLIVSWVFTLSESVHDTPISAIPDSSLSPAVQTVLNILSECEQLCHDSPPDETGGSRFGNKAFRTFLDKVASRTQTWHSQLGLTNPDATAEVSTYLNNSFGNRSRIDYGSGHELNFIIYLLCLYRLNLLSRSDFPALVLKVFSRYLIVMRTVQLSYYLEPAGSHGVWGLDDYQFLPFLFGASQLLHHKFITPLAIHQELTLEEFGKDYLYLNQVSFVNSTKTVRGLRWHSPMLDDISASKSWTKIEAGMRRMFIAEVLRKLPVMQHFLFGGLVPAVEAMGHMTAEEEKQVEEGEGDVEVFDDEQGKRHVHGAVGWGDCCGIKVPSSVAAAMEARKRGEGGLRRIPFD